MSQPIEFSGVTAIAKANVYFEGKVVSHTLKFADGSKKTLGLIYVGEFHFDTRAAEVMQVVAGSCRVRLKGEAGFKAFATGDNFRVPADSGFDICVDSGIAEYICSFEV